MGRKLRYEIDLTRPAATVASEAKEVRSVAPSDLDGLAELMLDAYIGTIDYEGEDLDDAVAEVRSFFESDHPLLNHSYLVEVEGMMASAILVSLQDDSPFVGYVMTLTAHKNTGLARLVTTASMKSLAAAGHERAVLYITDGNAPSEAMFTGVGAVQTAD